MLAHCRFDPDYLVDSTYGYELMQNERLYSYVSYQLGAFSDYTDLNEGVIVRSRQLLQPVEAYLSEE